MRSLSLATFLILSQSMRIASGFRSFSHLKAVTLTNNRMPNWNISPPLSATKQIETDWSPSTVIRNVQCAEGLRHIEIEVTDAIATQYRQPGQYVKARKIDSKPVLFAIASPPDNRNIMSFLIKESQNHQFLLNQPSGGMVDLSAPLGQGFQIQNSLNIHNSLVTHVLLMACGSGLAPIAAAIESDCFQLTSNEQSNSVCQPRSVLLYIGARSHAHLPYAERYAEWEKKGIKVVPVFSRTEGRYIQEALRVDSIASPENTMALLCGMKGMTDTARVLLLEAGVPEGRILLNY